MLEQIAKALAQELYSGQLSRYAVPFIGGGAVFFFIAQNFPVKKYYISDLNHELIILYVAIQQNVNKLDENFRLHLQKAEAEIVQSGTRRFSSLLGDAVNQLEILLATTDLSANDMIRVIRTVLELYPRLREVASFESRLEALESSVENEN